jgi:hypothetical protein
MAGGAELRLPVEASTEFAALFVPITDTVLPDRGDGVARLSGEFRVRVAVGEGYPDRLRIAIREVFDPECGVYTGRLEVVDFTLDPGLSAGPPAAGSPDAVEVRFTEPGEYRGRIDARIFAVEGFGPCSERVRGATEVELRLELTVEVIAPTGTEVQLPPSCAGEDDLRIQSGTSLFDFRALPLDAAGVGFRPANASATAPLGWTLRGSAGVTLSSSAPALDRVTVGGTGTLRLVPDVGDALIITVLPDADIDEATLSFVIPGGLTAGRFESLVLEDGESYGADDYLGRINRILPVAADLAADGTRLCSLPGSGFSLRSRTPAVCSVESPPSFVLKGTPVPGVPLDAAARVVADGRCELIVSAPDFDQGRGLTREFVVDLGDTDSMTRLDR